MSVTDLDKNGVSESLIAYKLNCTSDISPSRLKILMHENKRKFGLRGVMRLQFSNQTENDSTNFELNESKLTTNQRKKLDYQVSEGRYKNELDFKNEHTEFLKFAVDKWRKLSIHKFE